ncbi:asparaginase [Actinomadura sp. KC06]|uniref:asparaginase n=1 Tax=Actinomadura sp. KC06 TaxID=2530369 RepID=UPI001FB816CF|nr:asparaginase [Actinomadura sp. KC06]
MRAGNPDVPIFPRSANKPMQAVAMLRAGLDLDGELLALAARQPLGRGLPRRGNVTSWTKSISPWPTTGCSKLPLVRAT